MRVLLVLLLLASASLTVAAAPPDDSVVIDATGDTYVVADVAAPDDPQGLRDKNFSGLDFLKIWYSNQVQATEQVVSVGLVKFDLSSLKDREVRSASLQLFAQRADLLQPVRLVDVSLAEGQWNATDVTFKTLPQITTPPLASTAVYAANVWYSWDVTPAVVRKAKDGSVSYAIGLRTLETKGEEQVVFSSSDAGRNPPRLLVTMAPNALAVPLYAIPAGIVAAAILAFAIGLLIGRRRRGQRATSASGMTGPGSSPSGSSAAAQAVPLGAARLRPEDVDATMDCPTCHREIPASAEVCPRCGAQVPATPGRV